MERAGFASARRRDEASAGSRSRRRGDETGDRTDRPTTDRVLEVQRTAGNRATQRLLQAPTPQVAASAGPGRGLPDAVRADLERAFGQDLSSVRIREGSEAQAAGAHALTRGEEIHFAPGRFDPSSARGRRLLAHEVAHVVQQRQGRVPAALRGADVGFDVTLEREADAAAAAVERGEPVATPSEAAHGHVATPANAVRTGGSVGQPNGGWWEKLKGMGGGMLGPGAMVGAYKGFTNAALKSGGAPPEFLAGRSLNPLKMARALPKTPMSAALMGGGVLGGYMMSKLKGMGTKDEDR